MRGTLRRYSISTRSIWNWKLIALKCFDGFEKAQRACLTIIFCGCPLIIFGVAVEDSFVANLGWAISLIALFTWVLMILIRHFLAERMPLNLEDED